ncbi:aldo/keto reductase [Methylocapsa aurea]|uniref:aldo/keto reductase n=1 Tax=Methylocapsa aurea TaxID=663610 RepID=UPI0012EB64C0|nr:aldo/keto reductase [Methylocapsa aurea]
MRTVACPSLGRDVSALGFACASLGSRVSESQGRRALDRAFERGVTWCDVAPTDADGAAESILGRFLLGRRDRLVICTKFGRPRAKPSPLSRLLKPVARVALKAFPYLRGDAARTKSSAITPLRAEMIEDSVVQSLRRLRTDYVDVLVLDGPTSEECVDEAILRALQRMVEKGYARAVSIAGAPETIIGAVRASAVYRIAQFVDNPFEPAADQLRAAFSREAAPFFVTRSAFGRGAFERIARALVMDGGRLAALASQLGYGPPFLASDLVLDYAFASNPEGVVLATMFNQAHIDLNCARASLAPRHDVGPFVKKYFIGEHP